MPVRVVGDAVAADHGAAEARARTFLTGVLGQEPLWLKAAQSFVADLTSDHLQTIARSPLVVAVHPNRHLG
ncbi:MAG: hypothetical protein M3083_06910 [Actinomycetota bacterium]|nr:hypothetical protein [Actinomycetota bacterium]